MLDRLVAKSPATREAIKRGVEERLEDLVKPPLRGGLKRMKRQHHEDRLSQNPP